MTSNIGNVSATQSLLNVPQPSMEKGQRSMPTSEAYFTRMVPSWSQPSALTPAQWRAWVGRQPVSTTCKETMISNVADLDWKITPRKSDQRDELKGVINHYEKLFRKAGHSGLDWTGFLEWSISDLLDLPFGSAWEVGRKGDAPGGRVVWMKPIDGGTLFPTNNIDYPVFQYYNGYQATFPAHAIARMYLSPRTDIERQGWGMAPPEKIFMAMEMLARGDKYYANLLLDVPPVGVFDLGDITWEDANTWIKSFREFANGGSVDSFKIPVLAEHTGNNVKFIPLGKDPNAIMYDTITLKYAALTVAGYGMSLGDIGLQGSSASGETLAGSIRSEQKTNRTGKARVKAKIKFMLESILPDELQFDFIDTDGERLSMIGRARLANATAMNQYRQMEAISPGEARLQAIQDGLFTISMPEEPPAEAKMPKPEAQKKVPERPGQVGSPQPPSLGGDGEVRKFTFTSFRSEIDDAVDKVVSVLAPSVRTSLTDVGDDHFEPTRALILEAVFSEEDKFGLGSVVEYLMKSVKPGQFDLDGMEDELERLLTSEGLYAANLERHIEALRQKCEQEFPAFLGKAIAYTLVNSDHLFLEDVVENVQAKINRSLSDYASTFVGMELAQTLENIKQTSLEVPESLRLRTAIQKPANSIVVEAPHITMPPINITMPERSVNVDGSTFNIEQPDINIPEFPAHQVVLNIPEQAPPIVNVSVPEREHTVNVSAPIVNVSAPEQSVPQVTVNVEPTPIEVKNDVTVQPADVKLPKVKREIQNVHRDRNFDIDQTVTDIEYED